MEKELKPCPFCPDGGNPKHLKIIYHSCESNLIKCMKCEASTCGYDTEEEAIKAWNTRHERTCHMTLKKSGPCYDVWYFDCCEKEWAENRCDNCVVDYPGIVCPWCGAKVVE